MCLSLHGGLGYGNRKTTRNNALLALLGDKEKPSRRGRKYRLTAQPMQ